MISFYSHLHVIMINLYTSTIINIIFNIKYIKYKHFNFNNFDYLKFSFYISS